MLIIQIALGILLGFLLLRHLDKVMALALWALIIAIVLGSLIGAWVTIGEYYKEIIMWGSVVAVFASGLFSAVAITYLIQELWPDFNLKHIKTARDGASYLFFGFLNFFIILVTSYALPWGESIDIWGRSHGYKDAITMYYVGALMLWPIPMLHLVRLYKARRARKDLDMKSN